MFSVLSKAKKYLHGRKKPICIILGNEACDLDSAVSAVGLAVLYDVLRRFKPNAIKSNATVFVPVLNINRKDYVLKTDVKYWFDCFHIDEKYLIFQDELNGDFIQNSEVILVDHHVSPLASKCVEIYDHQPLDDNANLPEGCIKNIELVGACATMICEKLIIELRDTTYLEKQIPTLFFMRIAIILETANFTGAGGRVTEKDKAVNYQIETLMGITHFTRGEMYEEICGARANVDSLSPLQILRKDLKVASDFDGNLSVAISVLPMLAKDFIKIDGVNSAILRLSEKTESFVIVLMGTHFGASSEFQRDIFFINLGNSYLFYLIVKNLDSSELNLESEEDIDFMHGNHFVQYNVELTRKYVMSRIKDVIERVRKDLYPSHITRYY